MGLVKRRAPVLFGVYLSGLVLAGPLAAAQAPGAEWERTLQEAKKEGQVIVYGSVEYEAIFKELTKRYPEIKVMVIPGGGPDIAQRLFAERRADKYLADLFLSGPGTGYTLYEAKVFDPIRPALVLPEVLEGPQWLGGRHQYEDKEGKYILAFNGEMYLHVGYNSKLANPAELRSHWDLLNPKWKGKIIALDPRIGKRLSSSPGAALRFIYYNAELGPDFLRRFLSTMDVAQSRDIRQITDWLAVGKYAISVFTNPKRTGFVDAKEQGLPVDWLGPQNFKEGVPLSSASGNIALINRAPHAQAARVAINWLLSREGQILYQKFQRADSLRTDVPKDDVPVDKRRLEGYKYVPNPQWVDQQPIVELINQAWKR